MIQCDCNIIVVSLIQLLVNKTSFRYYFFDLIVEKCEINRIPKCAPFRLEMFKIASVSGAPPQTPLRDLTTLFQTPYSREGLLAFGNRSLAPSALNHPLPPKQKFPPRHPPHT